MKTKNQKTIENAFRRFASNEGNAIVGGLKALLDAAVVYALQVHEERYLYNHLETGDSYGWAIGRQGQCIAIKVTQWEDLPSTDVGITEKLKSMAESLSSGKIHKYIGIVMAGMKPKGFYNIEIEEDVLYETIHMVETDFDRYFHEIPGADFDNNFDQL
jgi:hypothetical protein